MEDLWRKGAEDAQQLKDSRIWKKHVSTFERENVSFMHIESYIYT